MLLHEVWGTNRSKSDLKVDGVTECGALLIAGFTLIWTTLCSRNPLQNQRLVALYHSWGKNHQNMNHGKCVVKGKWEIARKEERMKEREWVLAILRGIKKLVLNKGNDQSEWVFIIGEGRIWDQRLMKEVYKECQEEEEGEDEDMCAVLVWVIRTLLGMKRHSSESPENRFVGSWVGCDMAIEVNIISFLYRLKRKCRGTQLER